MELHDPQTAAALTAIFDRTGTLFQGNAPEELVVLCRKLERELAASEKARRDEESWWKERHDYKDRAEKAEAAIIDIREKAALVANNGAEERDRFIGRQIILLCEKALVPLNPKS